MNDPATRTGAAPFLGLTGAVEPGSLDQVIDVAAYKGLHRCPVLVCPRSKVKGAKSTHYKFGANPSKFHVNGRHFCGVHKFTFRIYPDALKRPAGPVRGAAWSCGRLYTFSADFGSYARSAAARRGPPL
jgi:hypothetical protein